MLRQHVERAGAQWRRVLGVLGNGVDRGAAFQHLEAVGRHQHRLRRLVEPVVGAADALHQPRGALRRADIDDQIDIAPVDAEIERRCAHHRAQLAGGHGVLDLAALRNVERAVMQRDGEIVVVDAPQFLEQQFGLAAGVDEDQRRLVRLDQAHRFRRAHGAPNDRPRADAPPCRAWRPSAARRLARPPDRRALRLRAAAAPESGTGRPARPPSPTGRRW